MLSRREIYRERDRVSVTESQTEGFCSPASRQNDKCFGGPGKGVCGRAGVQMEPSAYCWNRGNRDVEGLELGHSARQRRP